MRRRRALVAITCSGLVFAASGCGGGERQDKSEPSGTFALEITDASFPAKQTLADKTTMKIAVRNADDKTVPNVAVTVATEAGDAGGAAQAFSQDIGDPNVSDPSRPVWIIDTPPVGGETSYTNTWALGELKAGQTKTFEWKVTAVKAGEYTIDYSASPGLTGKAKPSGETKGQFEVVIDDTPPTASVDDNGNVVREPAD
jgi:hypothetical protein